MTTVTTNTQPSLKIPKPIKITAHILERTSPRMMIKFATKLFSTPIKYSTPKREEKMLEGCVLHQVYSKSLDKKIVVYDYMNPDSKKIALLVHGWSGRGTQLFKIAEMLVKEGYRVMSFDGPAHGKSEGKTSNMKEFIETIKTVSEVYGPFEVIIGHSLGAMSTLNAVADGVAAKKIICVGAADVIYDIFEDFIEKLELDKKYTQLLYANMERKLKVKMDVYSSSIAAKKIDIPTLIIHDHDDQDVPISAARHIVPALKKGRLIETHNLGHRKILGDAQVIQQMNQFLNEVD